MGGEHRDRVAAGVHCEEELTVRIVGEGALRRQPVGHRTDGLPAQPAGRDGFSQRQPAVGVLGEDVDGVAGRVVSLREDVVVLCWLSEPVRAVVGDALGRGRGGGAERGEGTQGNHSQRSTEYCAHGVSPRTGSCEWFHDRINHWAHSVLTGSLRCAGLVGTDRDAGILGLIARGAPTFGHRRAMVIR